MAAVARTLTPADIGEVEVSSKSTAKANRSCSCTVAVDPTR